jgi:hypothetical protein
MKKILIIIVAAAAALAITSCKKSYTCKCTGTQNVGGFNQNVNYTTETEKIKKSEAAAYCDRGDISQNSGGGQMSVSQNIDCTLQ